MEGEKKSEWRRQWEEIRPHFKWEIIRWLFGGGVISGAIAIVRSGTSASLSWPALAVLFVISSIGYAGISLYLRWQRGTFGYRWPRKFSGMLATIIIYVPIIIGVAFCVWAYFIGSTLYGLNDDVRHLRAQMVRYVLPRRLTPEQTASIADYLSHQDPQQVIMNVINRDEEAGSFRADLQIALEKGGWAVSDIKYADDIQEGLSISMSQPFVEPPANPDPFERLHPKPNPVAILAEAFRLAKIQVQGTGGGSGRNITTTTITISIGHRRRDKWAVLPPNFEEQRRKEPIGELTDDEF